MNSRGHPERGFVLITVVLALTLLAAIAFALSNQGVSEVNIAAGELQRDRLRYVAEAGMAHAQLQLSRTTTCDGYTDIPSTPFGAGTYTANITPTSSSPVTITVTGMLATGTQRIFSRDDVRVYSANAIQTMTLQPGSEGEDTYIWDGAHKDTNFGATAYMELNNASAERVILMRFDLSAIPAGAAVSSAILELYLEGGNALSNGVIDAHRITQPWYEGEEDDNPPSAPGATYMDFDGTSPWANSGGDYDPTTVDTTVILNLNQGWHQWDLSALAEGGIQSALAADGVLLRASGGNVDKIKFTSSDGNAAERPKLTVTYACECGTVCAPAGGTGQNVLFVVGNVGGSGMTTEETAHQTLIESWGYVVELIDDDASQGEFDTAVANNDVVFMSNDITSSNLGTKLVDATIGVVTSEDNLSDEFGLSSSIAWESGDNIGINVNTHYITSPFSIGSLTVFGSSESLAYVTGTLAPDLDQLGRSTTGPALVALEAAATMFGGGTAAGRRVQLPWGGSPSLDPNDLTADGLTILRRAIEWGAGAGATNRLLFVVTDAASPVADEIERQTLVESWGYNVTLISDEDSQASFDAAASNSDLAYISSDALYDNVGIKLKAATIGVAYESYQLHDEFGMSPGSIALANLQSITITDNSHYITSPFTGLVSVTTSSTQLSAVSSYAPDTQLQILASIPSYDGALATFDTGDVDHWGEIVAGRRVKLPWGSTDWGFDFSSLSADGETILKRSLQWVAGAGGGGGSGGSIDVTVAVGNDDAEQLTSDGRMEVGSSDLELADNLAATGQPSDIVGIRFSNVTLPQGETITNAYIQFQVDETDSGAASLTIEGEAVDDAAQFTSADYNITARPRTSASVLWAPPEWTTVGEQGADQRTVNIAPIIQEIVDRPGWSSGKALVIIISGSGTRTAEALEGDPSGAAELHIEYGAGGGGGSCAGTFRDEFNAQSYSGSDGTLTWSTDWEETGETTSPTGGDIRIVNDVSNYQLRVRDDGQTVMREADLSEATSASLSFDYRRENLNGSGDFVAVEVSYDGGGSWSELDRFTGTATDGSYASTSYTLDENLLSANTRIRFLTPNSGMGNSNMVWIDNVEIACSP